MRSGFRVIWPNLPILLILAALLEGCIQEKPAAEDILNRMHEKYSSISSYKATIYQTEIGEGKIRETQYEVLFKKPDKARMEHVSSGTVTITNGSRIWIYNKTTGEQKLVINYSDKPTFADFFGFTLEMLKGYNASLAGEEKVGGKDCYVLSLKPPQEIVWEKTLRLEKLWVVKNEWYPARIQMKIELSEEMKEKFGFNFSNSTVIIELRDIGFNISINDAEFLPHAHGRQLNLSALSNEEVVELALNTSELEIYRGWNYTIREKRVMGNSLYIDMYFGKNDWKTAIHVSFFVKENGNISDIHIYPYVKTVIPVGVKGEEREEVLHKALSNPQVERIISGQSYYIWQISKFINAITGEEYGEYSVYLRINATNKTYVIYLHDGQINVRNTTCPGKTGWWC